MNILHIIPYYKPAWIYGGPVQSVSSLVESQILEGAKVSVYTTTANGNQDLDVSVNEVTNQNGADVYYFTRQRGLPGFLSIHLLRNLWLKTDKFDTIHIHNWWNLISIISVSICRVKGIHPVFSPRGMLSPYSVGSRKFRIKRLFQTFVGNFLLKGTVLHATSQMEADECHLLIPGWPFFILSNILTLPKISIVSTVHKLPGMKYKLIFLSRIHPKKGLEHLFKALQFLSLPWTLQIVGSGETDYINHLKQLALSQGIADHIQWLGWVKGLARFDLIASSDLLLLISENENFANVVIESLSVGTPVLISTKVGLSDYIDKEGLGWVTPLNVEDIQKILYQSLKDENQREWIRTNAPTLIRNHFAPQKITKLYIAEYLNSK